MIGFDIKWRGKKLGKDEWLIGSLYDDGGELYILPPHPGSAIDYEDYQINPNTIGIWIGRNDKYGRAIYTGDILKDIQGKIYRVHLMSNLLMVMLVREDGMKVGILQLNFQEYEVIGTVYD